MNKIELIKQLYDHWEYHGRPSHKDLTSSNEIGYHCYLAARALIFDHPYGEVLDIEEFEQAWKNNYYTHDDGCGLYLNMYGEELGKIEEAFSPPYNARYILWFSK